MSECVFCDIATGAAKQPKSYVYHRSASVMAFEPLNPVTQGHRLFVPMEHVASAVDDPQRAGEVLAVAAAYAATWWHSCNIITSCGAEATQTVFHLHVHVVPRRDGDGLTLPWTNQGVDSDG